MPPEQDPVIVEVTWQGSYRYISLPYQRTRTVLSCQGIDANGQTWAWEESYVSPVGHQVPLNHLRYGYHRV